MTRNYQHSQLTATPHAQTDGHKAVTRAEPVGPTNLKTPVDIGAG